MGIFWTVMRSQPFIVPDTGWDTGFHVKATGWGNNLMALGTILALVSLILLLLAALDFHREEQEKKKLLLKSSRGVFWGAPRLRRSKSARVRDDSPSLTTAEEEDGLSCEDLEDRILLFSQKEDKFARFKRWAGALRRHPLPARLPVEACKVEKTGSMREIMGSLSVFLRHRGPAVSSERSRSVKQSGVDMRNVPTSMSEPGPSAAPPVRSGDEDLPLLPQRKTQNDAYSPLLPSLPGAELDERIPDRILQFLMQVGPPKLLCTIMESEEEGSTPELPHEDLEGAAPVIPPHTVLEINSEGTVPEERTSLLEGTSGPLLQAQPEPVTHCRAKCGKGAVRMPGAVDLDAEEVLRIGPDSLPLTRELLWAALAHMRREKEAREALNRDKVAAKAEAVTGNPSQSKAGRVKGTKGGEVGEEKGGAKSRSLVFGASVGLCTVPVECMA